MNSLKKLFFSNLVLMLCVAVQPVWADCDTGQFNQAFSCQLSKLTFQPQDLINMKGLNPTFLEKMALESVLRQLKFSDSNSGS